MWLGAQFGQVSQTPDQPASSVTVQENGTPRGGFGAGDAPTDTEVIDNNPGNKPRSTRTARPGPTSAGPSPSESVTSPTPPVGTSSPSPSKTVGDQSDPPTKPTTTAPADPGAPPSPPSPPSDVETQKVYVEASTA
ncbi:hypothetical protein Adi01nite_78920 [Amorphoplanes digitatis]|nr:hypothetical protein Adi01nite_78920 [Actinoplanes digitatis]